MGDNNFIRKNLADKLKVDGILLEKLNNAEMSFMLDYKKPRRFFDIEINSGKIRYVFKRGMIKNYFDVCDEESSKYKGRILDGRLYLNIKELRRYIKRKQLNKF